MQKIFFMLLISIVTQLSFAQFKEQIINSSNELIQSTVINFKQDIKHPLEARMFDIGDPLYYNFLSSGTGQHNYQNDHLALVYFDGESTQFKVEDKITSFCFVLYNSKDTQFLPNYLKTGFFNFDSFIRYINFHELGHCFASYTGQHNQDKNIVDSKTKESLADAFAIAMLINNSKNDEAQLIIKFNNTLPKNDIHYNPFNLKVFYEQYKNLNFHTTHVKEIFDTTYELISNLMTITGDESN